MKGLFLLFGALLSTLAAASRIKPPVLPLFVRNPYLSLWYNARLDPWQSWPIFWHGQEIGFSVMAQLPDSQIVFPLIGRPQDALLPVSNGDTYTVNYPTFEGFQYDASTTNLTYSLNNVARVTLVFTSPITSNSTERQALPASYLEVIVEAAIDVAIYVDLNGLWVTHERGAVIEWSLNKGEQINSWAVHKKDQSILAEIGDRAEWGTLYFSGPADSSVTYEAGVSGPLRRRFSGKPKLANVFETKFREVMNDEPVFAFSKLFSLRGTNCAGRKRDSALFTIAFIQDPVARFASSRGLTEMRPLWRSFHANDASMLKFHYLDYPTAYRMGKEYSDKVIAHAIATVSETYADIVSISARQVMGATVFAGTPDRPILFLKEISSNGNFQTVDVIFPGYTFFLYTNPQWLAYLLEPLLEHQQAGMYPNKYSMHDLGSHFPNATGHPDGNDEAMPVEECGNMLAMGLSYARTLDDGTKAGRRAARAWIDRDGRYQLWKQWTGYLTEFGLIPDYQLSTDDFAGRLENQTNLAVKAIIGIRAMSELSKIMGYEADVKYYADVGAAYVPAWVNLAMSSDGTHTKLAYHLYGSWGTLYNLFPDSLLCFAQDSEIGFFPYSIYQQQSRWYSAVLQKYGLPLDTRHMYTKSDWEVWAAAISSETTRHTIIELIGVWLNETPTDRPFTDLYDSQTGAFPGINFMARPVAGAHFAILALDNACNGTGLKYLNTRVFSTPVAEIAFAAALNPEKSKQNDVAEGEPSVDAVPKFAPFPPGQGWPDSVLDLEMQWPEVKVEPAKNWKGEDTMTKQW